MTNKYSKMWMETAKYWNPLKCFSKEPAYSFPSTYGQMKLIKAVNSYKQS